MEPGYLIKVRFELERLDEHGAFVFFSRPRSARRALHYVARELVRSGIDEDKIRFFDDDWEIRLNCPSPLNHDWICIGFLDRIVPDRHTQASNGKEILNEKVSWHWRLKKLPL